MNLLLQKQVRLKTKQINQTNKQTNKTKKEKKQLQQKMNSISLWENWYKTDTKNKPHHKQ